MNHKYVALDALRGIAALLVAFSHAGIMFAGRPSMENVGLAVDFFFMLSGFVLAHAYGDRLAEGRLWDYLRARVVRLFPLIILGTLLGAAPYFANGRDPALLLRLVAQGAVLLPEPSVSFSSNMFPFNPPAWSLFHEIIASVLFGLGVWRGRLLVLPVILASIALVWMILTKGTLDPGADFNHLHVGLIRVLFGFGVGVALYRAKDVVNIRPIPLWILSIVFVGILLGPTEPWFLIIATFLLFPLLILSAARSKPRFLRLARLSGDLSYPIYTLHWPIYLWVIGAARVSGLAFSPALLAMFGLVATALGAFVILRIYDAPVRARLAPHRPPPGKAGAAKGSGRSPLERER